MSPRHAAVLGRPIAHSLSPVLHTAAYRALGLDWTYEAIDCGVPELGEVLAGRSDWVGFSCTMPLKHAALDVASVVGDSARLVGAANTLLSTADGWRAENTDVDGVLTALTEAGARPSGTTVLGAGGTAQAVIVALARWGVPTCTVLVRDPARATALLATAERAGVSITLLELDGSHAALAAPVIVSTLPPHAADGLAGRPWFTGQVVLDVAYDPWPSALATAAATAGARVASGASMLLHQAAAQVRLMTGQEPPVAAMRSALAVAAPGCGV